MAVVTEGGYDLPALAECLEASFAALSTDAAAEAAAGDPYEWDPEVLRHIERELAVFIGPMARVLVRKLAPEVRDVKSLSVAVGNPARVVRSIS